MKKTRVALLDGGKTYAKEYQALWNLPSEAPIVMPTYGVLIDHADGRYLFDTGFDLAFFEDMVGTTSASTQTPEQTVPGQLALLGLRPDDVNYVVNSHYHFDHCGGNKHCPHAITICHKCELEAALDPEPFEARTYGDRSFLGMDEVQPDIYTRNFETLTGDQEIAKGVFLFETPGHTLGHYSLMVKLSDRRPMLFTGDACYSERALDMMIMPAQHVDPVRGYKSMQRLKDLAEEHDAEIFFAHDQENFDSYLKAPGWYS